MKPRIPVLRQADARCGLALTAGCFLLLLAGCPDGDRASDDQSRNIMPEGLKLRLLVVEDPALAGAVGQLRGEWNAQTGTDFEVQQMTFGDLAATDKTGVDAIICPSHYLGSLAEAQQIVPIPEALLEDHQRSWSEIFSLLRARESVWGTKVLAIPFGSPVLTCYYRADLLEKLNHQPPRTWAEYHKLGELLADRKKLGDSGPPDGEPWYGAIEPLGPGWAAQVLLARAAAYATHRENYSALFNIDTMEPLIDRAPFIRALEELVASAALGSPGQLAYDPGAVRAAFWEGRCGLALSWPTAAKIVATAPGQNIQVGFAELPGSTEVYNFTDQRWEARGRDEDPHVPLLAIAGRVGTVTRQSQSPVAVVHLLFWLSDEKWSRQVSAVSPATTLFRKSHLEDPGIWVERQIPASGAAAYATLTEQTLSRQQRMFALRIPGRAEYLAALEEGVHRAVRGQQTPEESLARVAALWGGITQRLGRDRQAQAYRRSLGLD